MVKKNIFTVDKVSFNLGNFKLSIDSLIIKENEKVAILGENGSGKTTFLNILSGYYNNYSGEINFLNKNFQQIDFLAKSKSIAYLPQFSEIYFGYTVFETVLFGRFPYLVSNDFTENDYNQTIKFLKLLDLLKYKNVPFANLSGGEKRRVMIARVLNQDTSVVLMDEPTSMVDIKHSLLILNYFQSLNKTIIVSIHDLNLAFKFFDRFLFFKNGTMKYNLLKNQIKKEILNEIFEVNFFEYDNRFFVE